MTKDEQNAILSGLMPKLVIDHRRLMFAHCESLQTIRISRFHASEQPQQKDFGEISIKQYDGPPYALLCLNGYYYRFDLCDPDSIPDLINQIRGVPDLINQIRG